MGDRGRRAELWETPTFQGKQKDEEKPAKKYKGVIMRGKTPAVKGCIMEADGRSSREEWGRQDRGSRPEMKRTG